MKIRTIQDANTALLPYVPLVSQLTGKDTTLDRIRPLMQYLDNPQDKLNVIHIAGTSGKTSTAYFLSSLIRSSGKKVGMTVSPHIDSVTERVQINNEPLYEAKFCSELETFLEKVEESNIKPSYFELLYAFSMWVFVRQEVDYAVIETGMGGLHDATNIIDRPDKICVITDIGIDHAHILGNNLKDIALQKIGIVHAHNQVFCYEQINEVMEVFKDWVDSVHASLNTTTQIEEEENSDLDFEGIPYYQQRNWLLAYKVFRYLMKRDKITHLTRQALIESFHVQVPARMEVKEVAGKTIIMDGAHNGQKMVTFIESFKKLFPDKKPIVIIALKKDKDFNEVVEYISEIASNVVTTTFSATQDLMVESMDSDELAAAFKKLNARSIRNPHEAFEIAMNEAEDAILITGSFYLLSQLRYTEHLK
ncbi:MAG: bifunctional folylpolyglutamate synthase/dihydrofolate synthase [Candidatus Saccharimonadales bacterium]